MLKFHQEHGTTDTQRPLQRPSNCIFAILGYENVRILSIDRELGAPKAGRNAHPTGSVRMAGRLNLVESQPYDSEDVEQDE